MLGFAKVGSIFSFPKHSALIRNSERGVTVSCEHAGKCFSFSNEARFFCRTETMPLSPPVLWAQRSDFIYLTVQLTDISVSLLISNLFRVAFVL